MTHSDLAMDENDIQDYDVLNQLAKGGQGTTSRVRRKRDNTIWVMKESYVDNTKAGNSALREAKTLQSLNHPFISPLPGCFPQSRRRLAGASPVASFRAFSCLSYSIYLVHYLGH